MECENIIEGYMKFLSQNLIDIKERGYCQIELPFPRPSGDSIILKITEIKNGNYMISDDGFMDAYLFNNGLDLWDLGSEKAKDVFSYLRKRYGILSSEKPKIVILVTKHNLYERIFEMSSIMNELSSLKMLAPSVQFPYFRNAVTLYFKKKRFEVKYDPDNIQFEWTKQKYSFNLDFLFYKKNIYVKLISSVPSITGWALRFNLIKDYYETQDKEIILWTIFNDKAGITSDEVYKWFRDSVDMAIPWYSQKEDIELFLRQFEKR